MNFGGFFKIRDSGYKTNWTLSGSRDKVGGSGVYRKEPRLVHMMMLLSLISIDGTKRYPDEAITRGHGGKGPGRDSKTVSC